MSKTFGERDAADVEVAPAATPIPGKITRTAGFGTSKGEKDGVGDVAGPTNSVAGGTNAVPATTGAVKVTHETDQDTPSGAAKTRTKVGVGELVYFTADTASNKSKWSTTTGSGKVQKDPSQYNWTAPATPTTSATITFDPGDGGAPTTITMTVIGPNAIEYSDKKVENLGAHGAGMTVKLTFKPLDVCFWGTQWRETDVDATDITGWFTHMKKDDLKHHAAAPRDIGSDNSGPGDHISWKATGPFGEDGTFKWVIPQQYSVKGANNWQDITTAFTHLTTIDTAGSVTVSKNGETAP